MEKMVELKPDEEEDVYFFPYDYGLNTYNTARFTSFKSKNRLHAAEAKEYLDSISNWCCLKVIPLTKCAICCICPAPCIWLAFFALFFFIIDPFSIGEKYPFVVLLFPIEGFLFMILYVLFWATILNIFDRLRYRVRQCCICMCVCCRPKTREFNDRGVIWEVGDYGAWMEAHFVDPVAIADEEANRKMELGSQPNMNQPKTPGQHNPEPEVIMAKGIQGDPELSNRIHPLD